jgi:hypothetical protein
MKKPADKPRRGRPPLMGETGQRYQVTIPPSIAARLRAHGDGSLSRGIIRTGLGLLTKKHRKSP